MEAKELRIGNWIADRGRKEFYYGDKVLWALNEKSADKKAKRLGYI